MRIIRFLIWMVWKILVGHCLLLVTILNGSSRMSLGYPKIQFTYPPLNGEDNWMKLALSLLRVTAGQQKQESIDVDTVPSLLRCSPKGELCLTGYAADTIIDTKTANQILWLSFPE